MLLSYYNSVEASNMGVSIVVEAITPAFNHVVCDFHRRHIRVRLVRPSIALSTDNYVKFVSFSSALMVIGGTLAATLIC